MNKEFLGPLAELLRIDDHLPIIINPIVKYPCRFFLGFSFLK